MNKGPLIVAEVAEEAGEKKGAEEPAEDVDQELPEEREGDEGGWVVGGKKDLKSELLSLLRKL
ncbi:MAG: hypothetical protein A2V67_18105 [Deltaproteobacteria bacterium RBG_13_61_14]|nr:MAG: hypothetical protein A2V67_18105 [Deltaproteobacteria bacterium RBG_13_61_14]